MAETDIDIRQVLDERPVGGFQWRVIGLCLFVALLDGFDTQIIAFTGPAIAKGFGMSPADMTWIFIAGTLGMAIGAMGLGMIGDRIGRRRAILAAIALFSIFSFAIAFARSPMQIVVLRFLTGLGMGGATPVLLALAAEYSPARLRGAVLTVVLLGLPAGALLGGVLAAGWMAVIGWQGMYLVGGAIPMVIFLVCLLLLPESPQFLAARGRPDDIGRARRLLGQIIGRAVPEEATFTRPEAVEQGSVRGLFAPAYRTSTVAIWAVYLFNWIAWFMFLLWLPTVLTRAGLEQSTAALGTVVVNAAFIVCAIPLSLYLPRLDIRRTLAVMFAIGIAICLGLAAAGSNWTLVFVLIAAGGFGIGGQQIALNYLIASTYPTELRATGTGWAIGIGRTGAIAGSALGGWVLQGAGVPGYYIGLAVPLAVAACAVALVQTRVRRAEAAAA
jgi:AAHS family 4-hydroxybenzoate transporter-like MFS transporter